MGELGEWQGGKVPGGCILRKDNRGRENGWRVVINGFEGKKLPKELKHKNFAFSKWGGRESALVHAKAHQRELAKIWELSVKNQYRYRIDPEDGRPYIEFHIKNKVGEEYYAYCDIEDLSLLEENVWSVVKEENNIYLQTAVIIDGWATTKRFHSFKHPDLEMIDHIDRNGLNNRDKNLREGSGGVNDHNRRRCSTNTSGVNAVHYDHRHKAWVWRAQVNGVRSRPKYFPGPKDTTHPSFLAACAWQKEKAATIGCTNGQ